MSTKKKRSDAKGCSVDGCAGMDVLDKCYKYLNKNIPNGPIFIIQKFVGPDPYNGQYGIVAIFATRRRKYLVCHNCAVVHNMYVCEDGDWSIRWILNDSQCLQKRIT